MPERRFLIFFNFFWEFSSQGRVGTEYGTKTFFSILGQSPPGLDRNNAVMMCLTFLNFFAIFFGNFLAKVGWEWNLGLKFFSFFLGLCYPTFNRNNAGMMFFISLNFFAIFFLEFSCPGWVGTEFGTKTFFLSFYTYLIQVWIEIMPE